MKQGLNILVFGDLVNHRTPVRFSSTIYKTMSIEYIKHDLYPDSILIRKLVGKVDANSIMDSWEFLIKNKLITESLKGVINDLTNCDLCMNIEKFKMLLSFMKDKDELKSLKLAVVCNNPQTIVFPILGEMSETELKIKPFSTMKAAENWILY